MSVAPHLLCDCAVEIREEDEFGICGQHGQIIGVDGTHRQREMPLYTL